MVDSTFVDGVGGSGDAEVPSEQVFAEGSYVDVVVVVVLIVNCAHVRPVVGDAHFDGVFPFTLDSSEAFAALAAAAGCDCGFFWFIQ